MVNIQVSEDEIILEPWMYNHGCGVYYGHMMFDGVQHYIGLIRMRELARLIFADGGQ